MRSDGGGTSALNDRSRAPTDGVGRESAVPPPEARTTAAAALAVALTLAALSPVLTTVVTRAGRAWLPVQDFAVVDLRVRDVWSLDLPLVGAYSRYGWNHPGPWLYWASAPLSGLFGRPAWATLVAFALLQGVAIIWLARLCWLKGGLPCTAFALSVIGLWYASAGTWLVLEPWNPHVAVPFFVLFVFQMWMLSAGDLRRLPGAAVTATLVVQAHIGYLPLVVAAVVVAVVVLRRDRTAGRLETDGLGRLARRAAIITALLWLPPLLEEVRRFPRGSMSRTIDYFVLGGNEQAPLGVASSAGLVAAAFRSLAPFGREPAVDAVSGNALAAPLWWLFVPLLFGLAGALAVRRTRNRSDSRLLILTSALLGVAFVAISRISDQSAPYLFYWRVPVAVLFLGAATKSIVRAAGLLERPVLRRALVVVLAVAAVAPALALSRSVAATPRATEGLETDALAILDHLPTPVDPTIVRFAGPPLKGLQAAVVDELDRRGAPVRVDLGGGFQWGYGREASVATAHEVWYTVEDGQYASLLSALPGARVIAATTPLAPEEEAELADLERAVAAQLVRAARPDLVAALDSDLVAFATEGVAGVDGAAVDRIAELNAKVASSGRCRCSVIAFAAGSAPPLTANPQDPPQLWTA